MKSRKRKNKTAIFSILILKRVNAQLIHCCSTDVQTTVYFSPQVVQHFSRYCRFCMYYYFSQMSRFMNFVRLNYYYF